MKLLKYLTYLSNSSWNIYKIQKTTLSQWNLFFTIRSSVFPEIYSFILKAKRNDRENFLERVTLSKNQNKEIKELGRLAISFGVLTTINGL